MLEILTYGNPELTKPTVEVQSVGDAELLLIGSMIETMYEANGVGLAAPQVGEHLKLFVLDADFDRNAKDPDETRNPRVFINPVITWESDEDEPFEEGCLSLPDIYAQVWRPKSVRMKWRDDEWIEHEEVLEGYIGRIAQHEYDHLISHLLVDRISQNKRIELAPKLAALRDKKKR